METTKYLYRSAANIVYYSVHAPRAPRIKNLATYYKNFTNIDRSWTRLGTNEASG